MFNKSQKIIPIINDRSETIQLLKTRILGKTYNEAKKIYENLRVIKINDRFLIVTMEHSKDRCNIILKDDIIVDVVGFY
jgi:hypothetical protein